MASRNGAIRSNISTGRKNAARITFQRAFMRRRRRPVFLGVDCHPIHRAKIVAASIQSLKGKLELHFLRGDALDLNLDAFVWADVLRNGTSKTPRRKLASRRSKSQVYQMLSFDREFVAGINPLKVIDWSNPAIKRRIISNKSCRPPERSAS